MPHDEPKIYPEHNVFFECGQCGHWHSQNLPGSVDCRDDRHRFTSDELDAHYGENKWQEISLEDQQSRMEDDE